MKEIVGFEIQGTKGYFYVMVNGNLEGRMTFFFDDNDIMNIRHTEVKPGNEGKGFGKKMVSKAAEFARARNIQIIPICPFAKSVLNKTPEFRDLL
jgi:predicted GNAT family acetyltransferase